MCRARCLLLIFNDDVSRALACEVFEHTLFSEITANKAPAAIQLKRAAIAESRSVSTELQAEKLASRKLAVGKQQSQKAAPILR